MAYSQTPPTWSKIKVNGQEYFAYASPMGWKHQQTNELLSAVRLDVETQLKYPKIDFNKPADALVVEEVIDTLVVEEVIPAPVEKVKESAPTKQSKK